MVDGQQPDLLSVFTMPLFGLCIVTRGLIYMLFSQVRCSLSSSSTYLIINHIILGFPANCKPNI